VTGPTATPRGEHTPAPSVTWERVIARTETVIDDDPESTAMPGGNEPQPPRPNRATRRAMQRAARRKK
jgi:hypothetical protein